jgi:hypothetical protein
VTESTVDLPEKEKKIEERENGRAPFIIIMIN